MGRKGKLAKFAAIKSFPNVYENTDPAQPKLRNGYGEWIDFRGTWSQSHFNSPLPITLELACGKGEYARGLAQRYPQRAFIGLDIKGARLWKGAKEALAAQMTNVAFIRSRIEFLPHYFAPAEIDEIWITFPDPFLENSRIRKRLTSDRFLQVYAQVFRPGGLLHLKTDNLPLFEFSCRTLAAQPGWDLLRSQTNIYGTALVHPDLDIQTFYEHIHLDAGKTIHYLCARYKG